MMEFDNLGCISKAIVTGSVYASARAVDGQVSEFVSVGTQLDGIQMIGAQ